MNANFPSTNQESNVEAAEAMAHAQENFQRVNSIKETLGLETPMGDDLTAAVESMADQKRSEVIQRNTDAPYDPTEVQKGRYEITKAIAGNVKNNLVESGLSINDYGRVEASPSNGVTAEVAEAASSIVDKIPTVVANQTKVGLESSDNAAAVDGWLHIKVMNTERNADMAQGMKVREIALNAVGLDNDVVNDSAYSEYGVTDAGWATQTKYVATEMPGLYYKESLCYPPEGSHKEPISLGELTTIIPQTPETGE